MKTILIGLAFALALAAQPYGRPGYDDRGGYVDRSSAFEARIARGERMGLLSPREAVRLWDMSRELRYMTDRAHRSGFGVSKKEAKRIDKMRAQLDREITKQMRDRERYYRSAPGRW